MSVVAELFVICFLFCIVEEGHCLFQTGVLLVLCTGTISKSSSFSSIDLVVVGDCHRKTWKDDSLV